MCDATPPRRKWSWEVFWIAVAAIAAAAAAGIACWTTLDAQNNAAENLKQQRTMAQGTVMSTCMDEYFTIRRDATEHWRPEVADTADGKRAEAMYSARVYGLHFKEYHLYQRKMIPRHVYEVWLKGLKREIDSKHEPRVLPKLDFTNAIDLKYDKDFNEFLGQVLSSTDAQIPEIVSKIPSRADD